MIRANIDYYARLVPLPRSIGGVTIPNDDGTFDIDINANLSGDKRVHALCHELNHIRFGHFSEDDDTNESIREVMAERFIPEMMQLVMEYDADVLEAIRNG